MSRIAYDLDQTLANTREFVTQAYGIVGVSPWEVEDHWGQRFSEWYAGPVPLDQAILAKRRAYEAIIRRAELVELLTPMSGLFRPGVDLVTTTASWHAAGVVLERLYGMNVKCNVDYGLHRVEKVLAVKQRSIWMLVDDDATQRDMCWANGLVWLAPTEDNVEAVRTWQQQ